MVVSSGQKTGMISVPCTSTDPPGGIVPEFGRTQYCFGAVVLTCEGVRTQERNSVPRDVYLESDRRLMRITQLQCFSDLIAEWS